MLKLVADNARNFGYGEVGGKFVARHTIHNLKKGGGFEMKKRESPSGKAEGRVSGRLLGEYEKGNPMKWGERGNNNNEERKNHPSMVRFREKGK